MSCLNDDDMLIGLGLLFAKKKKERKRSVWAKEWLRKRSKLSHTNLVEELSANFKDIVDHKLQTHVGKLMIRRCARYEISSELTKIRNFGMSAF